MSHSTQILFTHQTMRDVVCARPGISCRSAVTSTVPFSNTTPSQSAFQSSGEKQWTTFPKVFTKSRGPETAFETCTPKIIEPGMGERRVASARAAVTCSAS